MTRSAKVLSSRRLVDAEESLSALMERLVVQRLTSEVDLTKLLHDMTGHASYFASVCELLRSLLLCDVDNFKSFVFEAMHFARFRHLLDLDAYRVRYTQHIRALNIPDTFKTTASVQRLWQQSEGAQQSMASAASVLRVFTLVLHGMATDDADDEDAAAMTTTLFRSMSHRQRQAFVTQLVQPKMLSRCVSLAEAMVKHAQWTRIGAVFRFVCALSRTHNVREALMKLERADATADGAEPWCSSRMLDVLAASLASKQLDTDTQRALCGVICALCSSLPINADSPSFDASYLNRFRNAHEMDVSETSPSLNRLAQALMAKLVETAELLKFDADADADKSDGDLSLLSAYYEGLGQLTSVSTMSKVICCCHCEIGDFVKWLITRFEHVVALLAAATDHESRSLAMPKHSAVAHHKQKTALLRKKRRKRKGAAQPISNVSTSRVHPPHASTKPRKRGAVFAECQRLMRVMERILYLAPTPIKRLFVERELGALLSKCYTLTLSPEMSALHDRLLALCVNFVAHCPAAKHIVCFGHRASSKAKPNRTASPLLLGIFREAFDAGSRRGAASYSRCFGILEALLCSVDGVQVLTQSKETNLMHSAASLLAKAGLARARRVCVLKLLRNLAMQSLGQSLLAKYFLSADKHRLDALVSWLEPEGDEAVLSACCQLMRNLGFVGEFKFVFAASAVLIAKLFRVIMGEHGCEVKLSAITLVWSLCDRNSKHIAAVRAHSGCHSLLPLIQTLQREADGTRDAQTKILVNSLLDRCKVVQKLLIGL